MITIKPSYIGIVLAPVALYLIAVMVTGAYSDADAVIQTEPQAARTVVASQAIFYQSDRFERSVAATEQMRGDAAVQAAIVPHHLVASDGIASLLAGMRRTGITRVIIIGPNHEDNNPSTVATAHLEWETPLGSVVTDEAGVDSLSAALNIRMHPAAFAREHSVGALMPFVRHYFPQATVVPLLVNSTAGLHEASAAAQWLETYVDESTVVLFSLDFSHYETPAAAARYDAVTKEVIMSGDAARVADFDQRFVDSRATLMTALLYGERMGLHPDIVFAANANDFLALPEKEITTYLGVYWR